LEFDRSRALTRTGIFLVGIVAGVAVLAVAGRFSPHSEGVTERDSPDSVLDADGRGEAARLGLETGNPHAGVADGRMGSFIASDYSPPSLPEITLTPGAEWEPSDYRAIGDPLDAESAALAADEIAPVAIGEPLDADRPDWEAWKASDAQVISLGEHLDADAPTSPADAWAAPVFIGEPVDADAWDGAYR
jgi:hypothetical protein